MLPKSEICSKCNTLGDESVLKCANCFRSFHRDCVNPDSLIVDQHWWICEACSQRQFEHSTNVNGSKSIVMKPQATSSPESKKSENIMDFTATTCATTESEVSQPAISNIIGDAYQGNNRIWSNASNATTANVAWTTTFALATGFSSIVTTAPSYNKPMESTITTNSFVAAAASGVPPPQQLLLQKLEEEKILNDQYLQRKYEILQGKSAMTSPLQPTPAQLATRQHIPKELPHFNGDPEDWPLFISCYNSSTKIAGYTDTENLLRLQSCLKGSAREMVKSKLLLPNMVPDIIRTLQMRFGRPELILDRAVEKLRRMPAPKDKLETIIDFALAVQNVCATMQACEMATHLHNPMLVREIVDKLPDQYKLSWAMYQYDPSIPAVKALSDWLYVIAEAASKVTSPPIVARSKAALNTHTQAAQPNKQCFACKATTAHHKLSNCESFRKMKLDERWLLIKENKLCRLCLNPHSRQCFMRKRCSIDACGSKHHELLHNSSVNSKRNEQVNAHNSNDSGATYFRIIPVRVHSESTTMEIFAFLDEGSSVSLIDKSLFDKLKLKGVHEPLCLQWTGDTVRTEESSVRTSFEIANLQTGVRFKLDSVHTVDNLALPTQSLDAVDIAKRYTYLSGIPLQSYENAKPSLLIGANNWKLAIPRKLKEGARHQPIASKCKLGWALQGCSSCRPQTERINFHCCDYSKQLEQLDTAMKQYFCLESSSSKTMLSVEDTKALHILNESFQRAGEGFEVGLPWRNADERLPNSYATAASRLRCLERRFEKDPATKLLVKKEVHNLLAKGYAQRLTPDEVREPNDRTWYLPISITINPNKPERVRLIWDAAAKSNGRCLNDFLLTGPDLLTNLIIILLTFRLGRVAIHGDISEMFHRIRINNRDMHALRFLYCEEGDTPENPGIFVMRSLGFGVNCGPCIAHYVRNRNADAFTDRYPRAVVAIKENHYVDDWINSMDDEAEAMLLAHQVKEIHASGNFHIRNWASNSSAVLQDLNDDPLIEQKPLHMGPADKILGLYWDPNKDVLKYNCRFAKLRRNVMGEHIIPTKREVLQVLMSIFDPMGFLSPFTTNLKILLQDVWRVGLGWDHELNDELQIKWFQWRKSIPEITAVEIPRCYSEMLKDADSVQLHTFVDAGEYAYAAVNYLRIRKGDDVSLAIVLAKSKVAPLKPLSIPRLELQAAVLGIRLVNKIRNAQRIKVDSVHYWSDSKTVLKWLRMDPRRFQQFVMHRISEILEYSHADEWHWVPSKSNPADVATKTKLHINSKLWFHGPDFLQLERESWPRCDDLGPVGNTELRRWVLYVAGARLPDTSLNCEYFSNWKRLYRAVATFLLYIRKLQAAIRNIEAQHDLDTNLIEEAKILLIRQAQISEYRSEILTLKHGDQIESDSALKPLNVYLDENDVLRVRSRAEYLNNNEDATVLPRRHHVTFLIVRDYHERFHHAMHETVINLILSRFYIPKLRVLHKSIRKSCQRCKNDAAKPQAPQMSPVPIARLATFERPFTFVGMDYFGPLMVAVGRRREKRWGVIFTCLTVRAVHIEVSHSLDTSSCLMSIRNFMSRRGTPREVFTDNGTNFRAVEKILRECLRNVDFGVIASAVDNIKWRFNPPAAPHMGGSWERLIRTVKDVLYRILPSTNFDDEALKSGLCEVEFIINSRPLTFVSIDSSDDEALTPNHLLLGSSSGFKPICTGNVNLRDRWHQTQTFIDIFWRRWISEYTPVLTRRSKWFHKCPPIKVGDVVIVVDEGLPRNCWPKGVVTETITAKDNQVRRATIRTQFGIMQRPASKIAILDVGNLSE